MTRTVEHPGDRTLIASVQRALGLVEIVANSPRPVTAKALASASGLSLGTTYNLARTLVHEGYLSSEPDGFMLGSRFPAISAGSAEGVVSARIRSALHEVTDGLGVTAYLSRYTDGEVHLVDVVDAKGAPRLELWVGLHEAAHATALGKQILAALPNEDRLDYLARHRLDDLTPHTIRDRRMLLEQLERSAGPVLDREEYAIGVTCVAVPVRAPGVVAALAVAMPSETLQRTAPAEVARQLGRTAARLSLQLGAESPRRHGQFGL
ncbi:IclR family transcriptional regulator [Microbacterium sp. Root53]|nr:IclR family transcriptional regulator [Microbacterium sp. Root53]